MQMTSLAQSDAVGSSLTLGWSVENVYYKSRVSVLLLGFGLVNLPVPQICGHGNLITVGQIVVPAAVTSSNSIDFGPWTISHSAVNAGANLYTQCIAPDFYQVNYLPLVTSNGVQTTLPGFSPGPVSCTRIYASSSPTAPSGTREVSRGVVTEFVH